MYIPAYYYVQTMTVSKEAKGESIIITKEYASHSGFVDLIMEGISNKGWIDEQPGYEEKLKSFIENWW